MIWNRQEVVGGENGVRAWSVGGGCLSFSLSPGLWRGESHPERGEGGKKEKNGRKEGTRWVCIHERESSPAAIVCRARFRREKFEGRRQQRWQSSQHNPPKAKCATLSHSSTLSLSCYYSRTPTWIISFVYVKFNCATVFFFKDLIEEKFPRHLF